VGYWRACDCVPSGTPGLSRLKIVHSRVQVLRGVPLGELVEYPEGLVRPRTRGECGSERPCPWVGCRYHLRLDVLASGEGVRVNRSDVETESMAETCALDVADARGAEGATLDEVGELVGITRERVRQIEGAALVKLLRHLRKAGFDEDLHDVLREMATARSAGEDQACGRYSSLVSAARRGVPR